jgi:hypothetical protein
MRHALVLSLAFLGAAAGFEPGFRISFGFGLDFPAMGDENAFADEMNAAEVPFDLDKVASSGTVDLLYDASERLKLRAGVGFGSFDGAYSEEYDEYGDVLLAIITLGLSSLLDTDEEVIDLEDSYVSVEAAGYYVLARGPASLSVGGGPLLLFADRTLESPNTTSTASGSALGFSGALRLEQESGGFLGLPLRFFLEGGYRHARVPLEGAGDFELDFSGLQARAGLGLYFR